MAFCTLSKLISMGLVFSSTFLGSGTRFFWIVYILHTYIFTEIKKLLFGNDRYILRLKRILRTIFTTTQKIKLIEKRYDGRVLSFLFLV